MTMSLNLSYKVIKVPLINVCSMTTQILSLANLNLVLIIFYIGYREVLLYLCLSSTLFFTATTTSSLYHHKRSILPIIDLSTHTYVGIQYIRYSDINKSTYRIII